jgi:hypothetical protein
MFVISLSSKNLNENQIACFDLQRRTIHSFPVAGIILKIREISRIDLIY